MLKNIKDFSTLSTVYPVVPVDTQTAAAKATGWTPGSWRAFNVDDLIQGSFVVGPEQFVSVAEVRQGSDDVPGSVYANAHLIASAPDLYEALENLLSVTSGYSEYIRNARKALAKARGE